MISLTTEKIQVNNSKIYYLKLTKYAQVSFSEFSLKVIWVTWIAPPMTFIILINDLKASLGQFTKNRNIFMFAYNKKIIIIKYVNK